jgi:hypothetical protein
MNCMGSVDQLPIRPQLRHKWKECNKPNFLLHCSPRGQAKIHELTAILSTGCTSSYPTPVKQQDSPAIWSEYYTYKSVFFRVLIEKLPHNPRSQSTATCSLSTPQKKKKKKPRARQQATVAKIQIGSIRSTLIIPLVNAVIAYNNFRVELNS